MACRKTDFPLSERTNTAPLLFRVSTFLSLPEFGRTMLSSPAVATGHVQRSKEFWFYHYYARNGMKDKRKDVTKVKHAVLYKHGRRLQLLKADADYAVTTLKRVPDKFHQHVYYKHIWKDARVMYTRDDDGHRVRVARKMYWHLPTKCFVFVDHATACGSRDYYGWGEWLATPKEHELLRLNGHKAKMEHQLQQLQELQDQIDCSRAGIEKSRRALAQPKYQPRTRECNPDAWMRPHKERMAILDSKRAARKRLKEQKQQQNSTTSE